MERVHVRQSDGRRRQRAVLVQVAAVDAADQGRRVQRLHDVQHNPLTTPPLKFKKPFKLRKTEVGHILIKANKNSLIPVSICYHKLGFYSNIRKARENSCFFLEIHDIYHRTKQK